MSKPSSHWLRGRTAHWTGHQSSIYKTHRFRVSSQAEGHIWSTHTDNIVLQPSGQQQEIRNSAVCSLLSIVTAVGRHHPGPDACISAKKKKTTEKINEDLKATVFITKSRQKAVRVFKRVFVVLSRSRLTWIEVTAWIKSLAFHKFCTHRN